MLSAGKQGGAVVRGVFSFSLLWHLDEMHDLGHPLCWIFLSREPRSKPNTYICGRFKFAAHNQPWLVLFYTSSESSTKDG
jgi:hypothetical protein